MRHHCVGWAIFLPLNLIAVLSGMNGDALPLIHQHRGVFCTMGFMAVITPELIGVFLGNAIWHAPGGSPKTRVPALQMESRAKWCKQ